MQTAPSEHQIAAALRSVRPAIYRLEATEHGCTVTLVMRASAAGRANAAEMLAQKLAEHGMRLRGPHGKVFGSQSAAAQSLAADQRGHLVVGDRPSAPPPRPGDENGH